MEKEKDKKSNRIKEEIKRTVIARLEILSSDKKICIGSLGEFSKEEMIEETE